MFQEEATSSHPPSNVLFCHVGNKMKRRKGSLTVWPAAGMLTLGDPALSTVSSHWDHSAIQIGLSLACGAGQAGTET